MKGWALDRAALLRPTSSGRLAAAVWVLGAAIAGAGILHGHRVREPYPCSPFAFKCEPFSHLVRPGWVDPVALGICLLGLAAAVGVLGRRRPFLTLLAPVLVLAATVGGAVALSRHRVVGAAHDCLGAPAVADCFSHPRPGWVVPTMVGLVLLGLAGASGILAQAGILGSGIDSVLGGRSVR